MVNIPGCRQGASNSTSVLTIITSQEISEILTEMPDLMTMIDSVKDVKKTNLAYTMAVTTNFQYMLTHKSAIPLPVFTQLNYPCMG